VAEISDSHSYCTSPTANPTEATNGDDGPTLEIKGDGTVWTVLSIAIFLFDLSTTLSRMTAIVHYSNSNSMRYGLKYSPLRPDIRWPPPTPSCSANIIVTLTPEIFLGQLFLMLCRQGGKKRLAWFFQSVTDGRILGEAEDSEKRFLDHLVPRTDRFFLSFLRQQEVAPFIQSSG
jgi:hypothetical protein